MMDMFIACLEARDPAQGRFRSYRLEAGTDLLGAWLVDFIYGRIGTRGRHVRYVVHDEDAAKKIVRERLRRRASARKRIGVSYRFHELRDPHEWCPFELEQAEQHPSVTDSRGADRPNPADSTSHRFAARRGTSATSRGLPRSGDRLSGLTAENRRSVR